MRILLLKNSYIKGQQTLNSIEERNNELIASIYFNAILYCLLVIRSRPNFERPAAKYNGYLFIINIIIIYHDLK